MCARIAFRRRFSNAGVVKDFPADPTKPIIGSALTRWIRATLRELWRLPGMVQFSSHDFVCTSIVLHDKLFKNSSTKIAILLAVIAHPPLKPLGLVDHHLEHCRQR